MRVAPFALESAGGGLFIPRCLTMFRFSIKILWEVMVLRQKGGHWNNPSAGTTRRLSRVDFNAAQRLFRESRCGRQIILNHFWFLAFSVNIEKAGEN